MENYFSIANNILTGSLRPWTKENQDELKFGHLLNSKLRQNKDKPSEYCGAAIQAFKTLNFSTENENLEELKELSQVEIHEKIKIDIPQFFNKQTEFYTYLINNSFQCIWSGPFEIIEKSDEIDGTYKLFKLFNKLEALIDLFKLGINSDNITNHVLNTLGIHLFVTHSVLLRKFNKLIDFEVLNENELIYRFCPEFESEKNIKQKLAFWLEKYLTDKEPISETINDSIIKPEPITVKPQETQRVLFTPILDDNRPLKKGVASYHDLVRIPHRFGLFEEKLFQNDYITDKYAYCGKQGYKNQLAIIFHVLIEKNYFKKFNDSTKKKITSKDIEKFLSHRYDIDLDKQFRSYIKKPDERANFIEATSWLYQLPVC